MDKMSELALRRRNTATGISPAGAQAPAAAPASSASTASAPPPPAPPPPSPAPPTGWWMYHGDPEHTGYVSDSALNSGNVGSSAFTVLHSLELGGPVLSVPAVSEGFIYVGLGNSQNAQGGNGGALHKIDIQAGTIAATFSWDLGSDAPDAHHFAGMGMTPAVIGGRVYFGAFNGKFYCLNQATMAEIWRTDLRNQDSPQNQPVTNIAGIAAGYPAPVIWSSPVISADGTKLYVGCGEGENPSLFSFVFCLDTATGSVQWIYCTNKFRTDQDNPPNALPAAVISGPLPPGFTSVSQPPIVMGCSVWGAIAYDKDLDLLYCSTGNQQPEPNANWSWDGTGTPPPFAPELPSPGYSNGVLSLKAATGVFNAFFQVPSASNYRPSDGDIDLGGAPVIFSLNGTKVVGVACKNGSFFILDAGTLQLINQRQMLPYHNDGTRIETVDAHPAPNDGTLNPHVPNALSDLTPNENFSGVFNTGALYPGSADTPQSISPRIFFGMGGPNYHSQSPGIDFESTPFMKAIDLGSAALADAWPLDKSDPPRYVNVSRTDPLRARLWECTRAQEKAG